MRAEELVIDFLCIDSQRNVNIRLNTTSITSIANISFFSHALVKIMGIF